MTRLNDADSKYTPKLIMTQTRINKLYHQNSLQLFLKINEHMQNLYFKEVVIFNILYYLLISQMELMVLNTDFLLIKVSNIRALVLSNILYSLRKRDKMQGLPSILSLFRNEFNKFNTT